MLPFSVVKDLNVFKGRRFDLGVCGGANAWTRSFLKRLNRLSVGALSPQFPFRLIEPVMPYALSLS